MIIKKKSSSLTFLILLTLKFNAFVELKLNANRKTVGTSVHLFSFYLKNSSGKVSTCLD